jgi:hypothetical protein
MARHRASFETQAIRTGSREVALTGPSVEWRRNSALYQSMSSLSPRRERIVASRLPRASGAVANGSEPGVLASSAMADRDGAAS